VAPEFLFCGALGLPHRLLGYHLEPFQTGQVSLDRVEEPAALRQRPAWSRPDAPYAACGGRPRWHRSRVASAVSQTAPSAKALSDVSFSPASRPSWWPVVGPWDPARTTPRPGPLGRMVDGPLRALSLYSMGVDVTDLALSMTSAAWLALVAPGGLSLFNRLPGRQLRYGDPERRPGGWKSVGAGSAPGTADIRGFPGRLSDSGRRTGDPLSGRQRQQTGRAARPRPDGGDAPRCWCSTMPGERGQQHAAANSEARS